MRASLAHITPSFEEREWFPWLNGGSQIYSGC